jgi:hypothetical protein
VALDAAALSLARRLWKNLSMMPADTTAGLLQGRYRRHYG